jgi:hypothetical protein
MAQTRQSVAQAIQDIRINLQYQAEYLRRFDEEEPERIAKRLDRLRWDLKRFAQKKVPGCPDLSQ